ncbi:type II toxin-antitoxin system RelE/ParE family toxin [Marivirga tractuosa]|uniref:type II toxin-antitoxin system RelE/ParE family toxin n=1 Tax=Marivirga tractuosa TaxID=1006 RepID=UPI0035CEE6C9
MSYKVLTTSDFKRDSKNLIKKYKSLKEELLELIDSLEEIPNQGTPLGNDCYKIRLGIKSKGKGKSGGARVITCVKILDEFVYLLTIYDKSEKDNITDKELKELIKGLD